MLRGHLLLVFSSLASGELEEPPFKTPLRNDSRDLRLANAVAVYHTSYITGSRFDCEEAGKWVKSRRCHRSFHQQANSV